MEDLGSEYVKEQLKKKLLTDIAQKICNSSRHTPQWPKAQRTSITSPQEIKIKTTMKYHRTLTRMS